MLKPLARRAVHTAGNLIGRGARFAAFAAYMGKIAARFAAWRRNGDWGQTLAEVLLEACAQIDRRGIVRSRTLRSYVDVSVQVKVLRFFVDAFWRDLTSWLLRHQPNSRVALLVHAEILLEDGEADAAIESIDRALRIQAVCVTAQELLFRAYRLKREQGFPDAGPPGLDYDLSDKFCHLPFTHLSTGFQGSAFACSCPAWLPFSVGNVLEADSADAVWNSDTAAEIRRSILDGDYSYCSRTQCSFISARKLPRKSEVTQPKLRHYIDHHVTRVAELPEMVELNHDPTCNLACPSCRTDLVTATNSEIDRYARATERVILPLLRKVDGYTYITGGGEAFASKHFRSILGALNRDEYPGLHVYLITNGQLMTPGRWREFPNLPEMTGVVAVSMDAARPETYEKLRRPGKWAPLMKNLDFLAAMRRDNKIPNLSVNFVVQQDNFREMLEFVAFADRLGADGIWFQRVVNYGAYDEATFAGVNVCAPTHPDHAELLEILRNPILKRPSINRQMLLSLLPEAVASDDRIEFLY